jgi:hypothetical protein
MLAVHALDPLNCLRFFPGAAFEADQRAVAGGFYRYGHIDLSTCLRYVVRQFVRLSDYCTASEMLLQPEDNTLKIVGPLRHSERYRGPTSSLADRSP